MSQVLNTSGGASGLVSADLPVGLYRELDVDLSVTALSSGTINVVTKRKGEDGAYYVVDTPSALATTGVISRSMGAGVGVSPNTAFGDQVQVSVVVTGAPATCAWTLSVTGK